VLLVLYNLISHCSLEAVIFCNDNHIISLSIPLHGSHKIQPLDCGFFGPLKSAYSQERDAFIVNHAHQPVTQRHVADLFKRAYLRVATLDKAENSFRACGSYPFNPHVFSPEDFGPAQVSFVPNIAEKETNRSAAILQGDEASPVPSTSTNVAAPVNIPACGTSKEQSSSSSSPYPSTSKVHISPTIIRPLPQAVVSKQRKVKFCQDLHIKTLQKRTFEERLLKRRRRLRKVEGKLQSYTRPTKLFPPRRTPCVQSVEKNTKIHQKKTGYSVMHACKEWWHEACTPYESGQITCDYYKA
jgi:hypothetical protein